MMLPPCYHPGDGSRGLAVCFLLIAPLAIFAADKVDPLSEARQLYNQRQFDAALTAAERARLTPAARRSRRSDRRARVSRAIPRERRVRRPDERARAPAPHRSDDDSTRSSAPSSSSGSARRSISTNRTAPRRTCSRRSSTTAARCRPIRGSACWTGGRLPSIAMRGCARSPGGRAPINGSAPACATS